MRAIRLGLRGRLVIATSLLSLATLGGAFTVVSYAVNRSQQRQLDDALISAAHDEAAEIFFSDVDDERPPVVSDLPGPAANDVGPLPKFVAVYRPDGRLASSTVNFSDQVPPMASIGNSNGRCFDLLVAGQKLRAVVVGIPNVPGSTLLMAVPSADLDGDANFLAFAMVIVFAVALAWTAAIAWWIAGRLTRAHRDIVATTQKVAAGDLSARVTGDGGAADPDGLGRNINEMIERLALLLRGQQQFIAQAAHELRSPLTMLYGELSFALRRERGAEEYRKTIDAALVASRSLKILAEDLLSLARLGTESMAPADEIRLTDVISAAVASVSDEATRGNVGIEVTGPDATLLGRSGDLARLFRNLLENAVRHTPSGGVVAVQSRVSHADVTVQVRDQGAGVRQTERERIFEPFFRGSSERAAANVGAGLGLTIARDIARLHGGDVDVVDDGRIGGCFVVRLRLKREK